MFRLRTNGNRWAAIYLLSLSACTAFGQEIQLDVDLDTPVMLAGEEGAFQRVYLRVALTGFELDEDQRTPVNVAIVLDRSGSMQGAKLEAAKQAAIMAIGRLRGEDIVSVITYASTVDVLIPATRLSDKEDIYRALRRITAGDTTALFAGVSKGSRELRKFLDEQRVNRLILLSDGLANVGPSSPGELAELGTSLAADGIAVTTIGLGLDYHEQLMTRLAVASDGNHFFAEAAGDLERVYNIELGEVLSVIAQDVDIDVIFAPTVRPVRFLGREAKLEDRRVSGRRASGRLNQLYSRQTKYFLVEIEIPTGRPRQELSVASVRASYSNMVTNTREQLSGDASVRFTDSVDEVEAARNPRAMASVARQIGAERNRYAMRLRDEGRIEESREVLLANAAYLQKNAELYGNRWLELDAQRNLQDAENLDEAAWQRQRKQMEYNQFEALRALGYVQ